MFPGLRAGDMVAVYADIDYQCRKGQIEEYKERKLFVGCGEMQLSRDQIFCSAQVKLRYGLCYCEEHYCILLSKIPKVK